MCVHMYDRAYRDRVSHRRVQILTPLLECREFHLPPPRSDANVRALGMIANTHRARRYERVVHHRVMMENLSGYADNIDVGLPPKLLTLTRGW